MKANLFVFHFSAGGFYLILDICQIWIPYPYLAYISDFIIAMSDFYLKWKPNILTLSKKPADVHEVEMSKALRCWRVIIFHHCHVYISCRAGWRLCKKTNGKHPQETWIDPVGIQSSTSKSCRECKSHTKWLWLVWTSSTTVYTKNRGTPGQIGCCMPQ